MKKRSIVSLGGIAVVSALVAALAGCSASTGGDEENSGNAGGTATYLGLPGSGRAPTPRPSTTATRLPRSDAWSTAA